mgnify:CR=1 FL=1
MSLKSTFIKKIEENLCNLELKKLKRKRFIVSNRIKNKYFINDKDYLSFCSNDYLGLSNDQRLKNIFIEGITKFGVGSGASHLISGHSIIHSELENELSKIFLKYIHEPNTLFFSTGYMANLAVITSLIDKETEIFSEELNHASLIDGVRLSKAKFTKYPHLDLEFLEKSLKNSNAKNKLIVTDGVFSMDGDIAPINEMLKLCEIYGALLIIDDAHGFGVLGKKGEGILEYFSVLSSNLIYIGTLGKAAGVAGAFIVANKILIDWLVQKARTYIYTTASPPAIAYTLLESLKIIRSSEGIKKRQKLSLLSNKFRRFLNLQKWKYSPSLTPIQPILICDNHQIKEANRLLMEKGFWVGAIRPPTVPVGTSRLRVTFSANHSERQVVSLAKNILEIENKLL